MNETYLKLVKNIRNSNNPYEILSNVDNLKFLMERDFYKRNREIRKFKVKNNKYYKNISRGYNV